MATLADLEQQLDAADRAGDTKAASDLFKHIQWLKSPSGGNYQAAPNPAAAMPDMNPASGGSTLQLGPWDTGLPITEQDQQTLAGWGQGITNIGRGVAQKLGLGPSYADTAETRKLDAPLDATFGGKAGNFLGTASMLLPAAVIPGAATIPGSAAVGGALGLISPSTSNKETAINTAAGAAVAPVSILAARGLSGLAGGIGALAGSFTAKGQDRIAGNTLRSFAGTPEAAGAATDAMSSAVPLVPGVQPTAGAVSGNAGIAQLERTMGLDPTKAQLFSERNAQNRNALMDAINGIAGDPAQRQFFEADRKAAADAMYGKAFANWDPSAVTGKQQAAIDALLNRPSIIEAAKSAKRIAQEQGKELTPDGSLEGLHNIKTALDDKIAELTGRGKNVEANAVRATQGDLVDLMQSISPEYGSARATYADMSKPINRMDVGQTLADRLSPAINDFGQTNRLTPNAFANALRNGDATAQRSTGFQGATLGNTLLPGDLQTVNGVGGELARMANAADLGRSPGSNTAQNLVSQDAVRRLLGPMGASQSTASAVANNALVQKLLFGADWVASKSEPKVQNALVKALLDPQEAARLLQLTQPVPATASPLSSQLAVPAGRALYHFLHPAQ